MFDYQVIKLMHRHADEDWAPYEEGSHHSSEAHDPERQWLKGARIFKCTRCADEVAIEIGPNANDHPFTGG